jgi:hypothetical protein
MSEVADPSFPVVLSNASLGGYKAAVTRSGLGLSFDDLAALAVTFGFDNDVVGFEDFAVTQQAKANARAKGV